MAKRIETIANPSMLVWARETMGLDLVAAAQKAHVSEERLMEWESGTSRPSLPELTRLSGIYHRPLAVFFLPDPPQDGSAPRDFRHLPSVGRASHSPELRLAIRRAELRQDLAAELLEKEPGKIRGLLGSASTTDVPTAVARRARALVGIDMATQMAWQDASHALNSWIFSMESLGVLVFQASGIDVEEMRGLSLHHQVAPVILLNTADSVTARIFSLFHELGHLLLGADGLCNLDTPPRTSCAEEIFCNAFAGEFLVPADALLHHAFAASKPVGRADWESRDLDRMASDFSVSVEMILRRLVTVGKAGQATYDQWRAVALSRPTPTKVRSKGGPNFYTMFIVRHGSLFTELVLNAYHENVITGSDVAEYFETKISNLPKIEQALARRLGRVARAR